MNSLSKLIIILALTLLSSLPSYAGWKDKIVENQTKAINYISALQAGEDPDKLERPILRRDKKTKVNLANREIRKAMDEAEKLARAGKHQLIKLPEFKNEPVSEE